MSEKLLHKFLNHEITEAELETLKASDEYRDYIKIASHTADLQTPGFDSERLWSELTEKKKTTEKKTVKVFQYRSLMKYAAVFVLLLAGYFYVTNLDATVSAGLAEKRSFNLPDDSEVVLNAGSKVNYNIGSWNKERVLSLEGEAFFDVAKGKKFDVETTQGIVSVLGTQFNVQSRNNHFHVSCYEGLVRVSFNGEDIQLPAGNSVIIEDGNIVARQEISGTQPGWMFDESTFENMTLENVVAEMERQYGVDITLDNVDEKMRFSGAFTHKDLEAALKTVCVPLQLKYTIDKQRGITIYGD
ncbi:MAG: FecR domain-containing protein [Flavobacteriaceae bacterium]